jgi:hypothetical protein
MGGWVGPKTGLDDVENREFLNLPGLKLWPLCCPACSQSLYRLRYSSSSCATITYNDIILESRVPLPELVSISAYKNLAYAVARHSRSSHRHISAVDLFGLETNRQHWHISLYHLILFECLIFWNTEECLLLLLPLRQESQPPHECLRLKGDLLCNKWYDQQQSHCITIQAFLPLHTFCPQLPQTGYQQNNSDSAARAIISWPHNAS